MENSLIMHSYSSGKKIKINIFDLEKVAQKIFECLNIKIEHLAFCIEKGSKLTSKFLRYTEKNKSKIHNAVFNDECVNNVEFYSLNTSDFEPNSKLVISFDFKENFLKRINCVIDETLFFEDFFQKYTEINRIFIKSFYILSGYAFLFPNKFFPLSFSNSIFRKLHMPIDYKNIANLIRKEDCQDNKLLVFLGNCNFIYSSDTKLKKMIISILDSNDNYFENDDFLFWSMSSENDDIISLIYSDKYKEISKLLIDNDLLNNI